VTDKVKTGKSNSKTVSLRSACNSLTRDAFEDEEISSYGLHHISLAWSQEAKNKQKCWIFAKVEILVSK